VANSCEYRLITHLQLVKVSMYAMGGFYSQLAKYLKIEVKSLVFAFKLRLMLLVFKYNPFKSAKSIQQVESNTLQIYALRGAS
jgi:hypothetical protein